MLPDELTIIDRYLRPLSGEGAFNFRDDAALLSVPPDSDLVITSDTIARDVHFLADPPETIAQKALRVNLSDLAAKGADPLAYILNLALTPDLDEAWLAAFSSGLRKDQTRFGISALGGDTIVVPDRPVISVTAFGTVPKGRMVRRTGAKAGDELYVTGVIGGSDAGLALLSGERGPWTGLAEWEREFLVQRYRVPEPRTALAPALIKFASAAIDVSDGLVGDCDKLCAASGCSAIIEAEAVPLPPGLAGSGDANLLARLFTAGEDFEVLVATSTTNADAFRRAAKAAGVPLARIGALTVGAEPTKVLLQGHPLGLSRRAFVHGRVEGPR
jgi:thiamine-monophosphate kinase